MAYLKLKCRIVAVWRYSLSIRTYATPLRERGCKVNPFMMTLAELFPLILLGAFTRSRPGWSFIALQLRRIPCLEPACRHAPERDHFITQWSKPRMIMTVHLDSASAVAPRLHCSQRIVPRGGASHPSSIRSSALYERSRHNVRDPGATIRLLVSVCVWEA